MSWLQVSLDVGEAQVESIVSLLEQSGALSISMSAVSVDKLFHNPDQKMPYEEKQFWQQTRIKVLLSIDTEIDTWLSKLKQKHIIHQVATEEIIDQNWSEQYQQQYQPVIFEKKLAITPSWCDIPTAVNTNIMLDPGLAFGTGTHATTALCIEFLLRQDLTNKTVIDYGCGSGILAMAAAKLGAKEVYAIDIDPQALEVASINIERNDLQQQIQLMSVDAVDIPESNILIANILLTPLLELAPKFTKLITNDGLICLSGILAEQVQLCCDSYTQNFNLQPVDIRDTWACITGNKISS